MQLTIDNFEALFDLFGQHASLNGLSPSELVRQPRMLRTLIQALMMLQLMAPTSGETTLETIRDLWSNRDLYTESNASDRVQVFLGDNPKLSPLLLNLTDKWLEGHFYYTWDPREYHDMQHLSDLLILEGLNG